MLVECGQRERVKDDRPGRPREKVLVALERDAGQGICPEYLEALDSFLMTQA